MISEETKLQVLNATDIVDLINGYVTLKKAGRDYTGLCPFHPEKSASFHVYPHNSSYHCFGCKASGDAIKFVREHLGLAYADAVKMLAQRANIQVVEEARSPEVEAQQRVRGKLVQVHNDAAKWMHQYLLKQGGPGPDAAREYLKKRGLNREVAGRWLIGYAPDSIAHWREWARSKRYADDVLVEAGLFFWRVEGQPQQGTYARFRHRVMFPLRNEQGDVFAFSGRVLDPDQKGGKYINSPETPIFKKSEVFFGWDKTQRPVTKAKCAIICEGQIDLITAYEAGIENFVAPLGTAFTEHHARMLKRATDQVILCFDADLAGYKAAKSCYRMLAPEGMFIKVASLPPGEDPDSMIRKQGADAFRAQLELATDFFDFHIKTKGDALLPGKDREKSQLAGELVENLVLLSDKVGQDAAIGRCATRLNMPIADLRLLLGREQAKLAKDTRNKQEAAARFKEKSSLNPGPMPAAPVVTPAVEPAPVAQSAQIENWALRDLLRLALKDEETLSFLHEQASSHVTPWRGHPGGDIVDQLLRVEFTASDAAALPRFLATLDAEQAITVRTLLNARAPKKDDLLAAQGAFYRLQYDQNRRQQQLTAQRLRAPGQNLDSITLALQELQRLKREEVELEKNLPKGSYTD